MICVAICVRGRNVLIVGGGQAALRKATELLAQKAQLTICAPVFCTGFAKLPQTILLHRTYAPDLLDHQLLVYAATDSPDLNRTILAQARAQGSIALCASPDTTYPFRSMASAHCSGITTAVYTHGAAPALAGTMARQTAYALAQAYGARLTLLRRLRICLRKKISNSSVRRRALRCLVHLRTDTLQQLYTLCLSDTPPTQILHFLHHESDFSLS